MDAEFEQIETPKTSTDIVMMAMEQFGEAEPEHVIVLYTSGTQMRFFSNAGRLLSIGMLAQMHAEILHSD